MKLFNKTLIALILLLSCCSAKKECNVPKTDTIFKLFRVIENKMDAHRDSLDKKGIFDEPIGRASYLFKTVKEVAPQLLTNTKFYKNEMLALLVDTVVKKNEFTNGDIVYILYNLPTDDYVDLLNSVVPLYKNGSINLYIFKLFVFQDLVVSVSLYKNYANEKLQDFLDKVLEDNDLILKAELEDKLFRVRILNLKSGELWRTDEEGPGMEEASKIQPPVLDSLKAGN